MNNNLKEVWILTNEEYDENPIVFTSVKYAEKYLQNLLNMSQKDINEGKDVYISFINYNIDKEVYTLTRADLDPCIS